MAAILEQMLRMRLLKVAASDLMARNLRRNRKHWYATPMAIEEAVDEVKIARPATAGTYRNVPRKVSFRAGGECGGLFMPHMQPLDLFALPDDLG